MPELHPEIETERLLLRRFQVADLTEYLALFSHAETAKELPLLTSRPEAFRQMAMVEGQWHLVGFSMMAVVEKSSNCVIGRAGPWMPDESTTPEIGWAIHPDWGRKGFATEAALASCAYMFDRFAQYDHLVHHIRDGNTASQRTAHKIGAHLTDETYDHPIAGPVQIWATPRSLCAP